MEKLSWPAEKRHYQKKAYGLLCRAVRVLDIERGQEGEVGYTSSNNQIHLAHEHPIMDGLSEMEKYSFRSGVFAHEALHQKFTDFTEYERTLRGLPANEREIFGVLMNVLEDAAIEFFAPEAMGGTLLASLRFMIAHVYRKSKGIETARTPFSQLISAFIHFGDMGLIKGEFTFPEAKTVFNKTSSIFAKGVEEPVCKNRIQLVKEIFEISRPLWEEDLKQAEELKKMQDELSKNGKSSMRGKGRGESADGSSSGSSKASQRRKITIKRVAKEELEEMKKNGEVNGTDELPDGDVTILVSDEEDDSKENGSPVDFGDADVEFEDETNKNDGENNKESENNDDGNSNTKGTDNQNENGETGTTNNTSSDETGSDTDNGKNEADKKDENGENGEDASSEESENSQNSQNSNNNPFIAPASTKDIPVPNKPAPEDFTESDENNVVGEITEDEYCLSAEDLSRITKECELAAEEYKKFEAEENREVKIPDFPITSHKLGKRSCLNYQVSYSEDDRESLELSYEKILRELNPGIKSLTTQLKRIFENDIEEKEYRNSGKINLKRAYSNRVTARVFDRRVAPNNKSNFSVTILVDESGSMSGRNKYISARHSCIALAEVFNNLGIPCYIMGFTADTMRYDIVHNHYIAWKNTHSERLKLLNIAARANNCDGYSIRYATEILKKNRSENKLLIVLSDGQPAASNYYDGVADTKQAIRDAKKTANVLGVAIGNADTETIHYMYEKDFLNISNIDELFAGLSKKLQKMMKSWGD